MTTWNVRTAIVDLIEAASAEEAIAELHARLQEAGFEPYVDDVGPDAFESEES